jgi:hypothetical protein
VPIVVLRPPTSSDVEKQQKGLSAVSLSFPPSAGGDQPTAALRPTRAREVGEGRVDAVLDLLAKEEGRISEGKGRKRGEKDALRDS